VRGNQAAQALRLREHLGFGPVDIWRLIENVGIPVGLHDFGEGAVDGLYIWEDDEAFIVVNASNRASRQRFTAAHELGHHEMHRFEHDRMVIADQDIFGSGEAQEVEANAFAAYLLAPDEALVNAVGGRRGGQVDPDTVVELMRTFGLSYDATTWRLLNAGIVNRAERDALAANAQVEMRLRRAGIDEEKILSTPQALPSAHVNAALRLYEDHVVTAERLGELIDMEPANAVAYAKARGVEPRGELPVDEAAAEDLLSDA
jgi:Zn-dependent peptidase ImmA (M78 family)